MYRRFEWMGGGGGPAICRMQSRGERILIRDSQRVLNGLRFNGLICLTELFGGFSILFKVHQTQRENNAQSPVNHDN